MTPHRRTAAATLLAMALLTGCAPAANAPDGAASGTSQDASSSDSASDLRADTPGTSSTMPPASPATASGEPRTVTINTSGDLLWNEPLFDAARTGGGFDFRPMLASVRPFVAAADLAVCHQEVPLAAPGGPYTGWPRFRAPQQTVAAVVDAGFDVCTTASNHTVDDGWDGMVRTHDALRAAGVGVAGTSTTPGEDQAPDLFTTADGVVVGIVSQTFSTNLIPVPEGREWSVDLLDPDRAIADAHAAREAGADVVVFHMHAGDEYVRIPNEDQRWMANQVTASGEVDLVIGQHPHWVQPVEKVNGVWVVYSTGNLIASMKGERPGTHDGAIVEVAFREGDDGRFDATGVTWAPTLITDADTDPTGRPRVLLIPDELPQAGPELRGRLEESAARTRVAIGSDNTPGLSERTSPGG